MKIKATTADAYNLIHEGALALARAERQGIRIDLEYCERKKKHLTRKIEHFNKKLKGTKFFRRWQSVYGHKTNIYSNHQLSRLLYHIMKIEPTKVTDTGQGSTDEDALGKIDIPELQIILKIRRLSKVRDTYLEAFIRENNNGYIHPTFHLHTVRTYRSSSSDPNFQNIPKRDKEAMKLCRKALLPRPGHMLMEADFSSLEVMISACYHKDPVMLKYLKDKNADMHADMAKQIFMLEELDREDPVHNLLRSAAKNGFVFPQFYGDYYLNNAISLSEWVGLSPKSWQKRAGIEFTDGTHISTHLIKNGIKSYDKFIDHIESIEEDFWGNRFQVYNNWRLKWVDKYRKRGYLKMLTGFECSGNMKRNNIINYPIQGTAFHCLLFTFIELDKIMIKENWKTKLIGQIHDDVIMDVHPEELERVKTALHKIVNKKLPSEWDWIIVPLEVEIDVYGVDQPWVK